MFLCLSSTVFSLQLPTITYSNLSPFHCFSLPLRSCYLHIGAPLLHAQTAGGLHRKYPHIRASVSSAVFKPVLHRQAWVERPLGSEGRYCRTERWSILVLCSITEQVGGAVQDIYFRALLLRHWTHTLPPSLGLSADIFISVAQRFGVTTPP